MEFAVRFVQSGAGGAICGWSKRGEVVMDEAG